MAEPQVTIFVCVTCKLDRAPADRPGRVLLEAVMAAAAGQQDCDIAVKPVECLAVCRRPCTVALTAEGKWTYVVGDLGGENQASDIVAAARSYGASETGIVPWRERPLSFRKGVIARLPPLNFTPEENGC